MLLGEGQRKKECGGGARGEPRERGVRKRVRAGMGRDGTQITVRGARHDDRFGFGQFSGAYLAGELSAREGGSLGLWFAVGSSGACRRVGVPGFVITDQLALEGKKGLGLEVAGATVYTLGVLSLPLRLARDA